MFVGRDFVLKHIRVKHAEKVEEFKNQVSDVIAFCCLLYHSHLHVTIMIVSRSLYTQSIATFCWYCTAAISMSVYTPHISTARHGAIEYQKILLVQWCPGIVLLSC